MTSKLLAAFPRWKKLLLLSVTLGGFILAVPNFLPSEYRDALPFDTVSLGLDLQGGSHLLLEVKLDDYMAEQRADLKDLVRGFLRKVRLSGRAMQHIRGIKSHKDGVLLQLKDPENIDSITKELHTLGNGDFAINTEGDRIIIGYNDMAKTRMIKNVMDQSIEIVRRRIDETGTKEPIIQRQGDARIIVQVPGLDNPEYIKSLLGKTAKLTFHMVDQSVSQIVAPDAKKLWMEDDTIGVPPRSITIKKRVMLSGDLLMDARATVDQYGQPVVSFRFNTLGAKKFAEITKDHVGEPFAIVLDNKVISAPVIREPILGGSGQISGNFTVATANDLALLLRAGALPAPLEIIEERTVGPSLGADSILAGKRAVILAVILVMLFMAISYGRFGIYSNISLLINILLIIAALSLFQATLTLPGIAGIVLTLGMAVDANVLIFERIKEEVFIGKTPLAAIDNGFRHAFKTIMDSNITTLIAALLLFYFGSGPVKGFAVTLSIGIIASMFSAIMLTRFLVVAWVSKSQPKSLPI